MPLLTVDFWLSVLGLFVFGGGDADGPDPVPEYECAHGHRAAYGGRDGNDLAVRLVGSHGHGLTRDSCLEACSEVLHFDSSNFKLPKKRFLHKSYDTKV